MRTIGIRRLKNEATTLLNANETLIVERRGTPIGVYITPGRQGPRHARPVTGRFWRHAVWLPHCPRPDRG